MTDKVNLGDKFARFAELNTGWLLATEEVKLLLIDPVDTPNTGDQATAMQAMEL